MQVVLTDQGMEWRGAFDAPGRTAGIEYRRTQPRHGCRTGVVARWQGTILAERWRVVFRPSGFTRAEQRPPALQRYLRGHNKERMHRGYRRHGCTRGSVLAERTR